jgi:putative endonuclease
MYYVYVLCDPTSGRLYVGRTDLLERRLDEHIKGKVWTTHRMKIVKLLYYEAFLAKADSIRRERYLKTSKGKSTLRLMLRESLMVAQCAEVAER